MLYKLLDLPTVSDNRGNLTFINNLKEIPFEIKRVFIVDEVPMGATRGGHAHYKLWEFLIPITGSFMVEVSNKDTIYQVYLNHSKKGILLPPYSWREVKNYTKGAICLSLCSEVFDESDYIHTWEEFIKIYE